MGFIFDIVKILVRIIVSIFFRDITVIGVHHIPLDSPVIICGNHANQFMDAALMCASVPRDVSFIIAAKSYKKTVIGHFAKAMNSIPVERSQDLATSGAGDITQVAGNKIIGEGTSFLRQLKIGDTLKIKDFSEDFTVKTIVSDTEILFTSEKIAEKSGVKLSYKILPKIDQAQLYESVWSSLEKNRCIGIFPEGGSHDRTEMLPLKAGVTIMSLGAANRCTKPISIVPCGLNYFKGYNFRSKVIIEFGEAYELPKDLIELYSKNKREAIATLLQEIEKRMRDVTIQAPSYSELSSIYLARSLYVPYNRRFTPQEDFLLNQRLAEGYRKFKDHPEVSKVFQALRLYYLKLKSLGIQDNEMRTISRSFWSNIPRFLNSLILVIISLAFALPGLALNGPIALVIRFLSEKERKKALANSNVKIRGTDVIASHKVICAVIAFPVAAFFWTFGFYLTLRNFTELTENTIEIITIIFFFVWPLYSYAMIRSADGCIRHLRRLRARFIVLIFRQKIEDLKKIRSSLQDKIREFIDKNGAEVLSDFEKTRIVNKQQYARKPSVDLNKAFEILEEIGL